MENTDFKYDVCGATKLGNKLHYLSMRLVLGKTIHTKQEQVGQNLHRYFKTVLLKLNLTPFIYNLT